MATDQTFRPKLAKDFLQELARSEPPPDPRPDAVRDPRLVHALIEDASRARASDIHLEPSSAGVIVRFRIDGVITNIAGLDHTQAKYLVNQFKATAGVDPVANFVPREARASCKLAGGELNLRLAFTPAQNGEALAIRLLDSKRLHGAIADLGLGPGDLRLLEGWIEGGAGMFLAAGPTGSGKTTTIYALLQELRKADCSIVSLEDPVEYQIDGIVQVQLDQRHHLHFGEGIKHMLRLDPDYLMLGEIRDAISARAAVDAAVSGRALLSTLHSRDAVGAVTALRNWGLRDPEIAEALSVVVGQRLVRQLCPRCRKARNPNDKERAWFDSMSLAAPGQVSEAAGCDHCNQAGFVGRTGIFELWHLNGEDYDLIMRHADEQTVRKELAERDYRPVLTDGLAKVAAGITSVSELRRAGSATVSAGNLSPAKLARTNGASRSPAVDGLAPARMG